MFQIPHNWFKRLVGWALLIAAFPVLWLDFWLTDPSTHRFLTDSPWRFVVLLEPIAAWWVILLLKYGHRWIEREFNLPQSSTYQVTRVLFWANLLGIPSLVFYASILSD